MAWGKNEHIVYATNPFKYREFQIKIEILCFQALKQIL